MSSTNVTKNELALSLEHQKILITGVSRPLGIGTAIARRCIEAGADIAVHGFPDYDLELNYPDAANDFPNDFVKELLAKGYTIEVLSPSDLSIPNEPARVIEEAAKKLDGLDGLVLNHAYSVSSDLEEWTAENIDAHFSANVRATMLLIQSFAKQIDQERGGVITLFTSGQYLGPMVKEIAYATSKEAIRGLCKQVAPALAPKNIRVNCINPGPTDTGYLEGSAYDEVASMFPSGRWGTVDDAAKLVQFLHSKHAHWITGQVIASEGGFRR
ncbi:SDR family oxidoreductase [bacterium]|nr:SDR family oxidoreductase [bacterium]